MTHWGWYWKVKRKHKAKSVCDYQTSIDSFKFFKQKGFIGFTVKDGEKVEIDAVVKENHIALTSGDLSYSIPFEKQPCHFGGFRYFFRCPLSSCNQRMRKLYRYRNVFLCRKCLNLSYLSQRLIPSRRYWHMENKVTEKLEKLGGNSYRKPKWMRLKNFEKLQKKKQTYYWKSEGAQFEECYKFYGFYP